jgi:hypothetical protein
MCDTTTTDPGPDYAALAAGGAGMLDELSETWWREGATNSIALGALDMGEEAWCVLGQLYGGWRRAPQGLAHEEPFFIRDLPFPTNYGSLPWREVVTAYDKAETAAYAALTKAWRELIKARRDADQ